MSNKVTDKKNRWRSKTVAFRVSPEEWEEIERLVKLSGMTKQEYIMARLECKDMVIKPNPRVVKYLKIEFNEIIERLNTYDIDENVVCEIRNLIVQSNS